MWVPGSCCIWGTLLPAFLSSGRHRGIITNKTPSLFLRSSQSKVGEHIWKQIITLQGASWLIEFLPWDFCTCYFLSWKQYTPRSIHWYMKFLRLLSKNITNWVASTTEIYCLRFLKAQSPRSQCLFEGYERESVPSCPPTFQLFAGNLWNPLAYRSLPSSSRGIIPVYCLSLDFFFKFF